MKTLRLRLIRTYKKTNNYTEGVLVNLDENEVLFDTLEDRVRDINMDGNLEDEEKVYGETAIPFSPKDEPYVVSVTYSPKFKKDMVLVHNVPSFSGIRLHFGSTAKNSEGCILGGRKISDGRLANTGFTQKMVDLVRKYDKVTLEII